MTFYVYILYSEKLKRYYIGSTELLPDQRLEQHNQGFNDTSFTTKGIPWTLYFSLPCNSRLQAQRIERHIKKMKSKKYVENIKKYSEMSNKLLIKYSINH